jgi:hypothetical protein
MGWVDYADGLLSGDEPADSVGDALHFVASEALRVEGHLPTSEQILHALVRALNLDGTLAPFYGEGRRIEALVASRRGGRVRVDGSAAPDWIVAELYTMLEEVARAYEDAWQRPPRLREILRYVELHLEEPDMIAEIASDKAPWDLRKAEIVMGARKAKDREAAPAGRPRMKSSGARVRHAKFGEGTIVAAEGDRITVQFGSERRTVLRSFVEILD